MAHRVFRLLVAVAVAAPAAARTLPSRAAVLDAVTHCRQITDNAERLACFDASVARLDDAEAKHDIVVVDQDEIKETRRSLFGLSLPRLDLFEKHGGGPAAISEIDAKVASAALAADGTLIVTLDDGAHWHQTDDTLLPRTPRPGDQVTIKRALMGSYLMHIRGLAIRVKREN